MYIVWEVTLTLHCIFKLDITYMYLGIAEKNRHISLFPLGRQINFVSFCLNDMQLVSSASHNWNYVFLSDCNSGACFESSVRDKACPRQVNLPLRISNFFTVNLSKFIMLIILYQLIILLLCRQVFFSLFLTLEGPAQWQAQKWSFKFSHWGSMIRGTIIWKR